MPLACVRSEQKQGVHNARCHTPQTHRAMHLEEVARYKSIHAYRRTMHELTKLYDRHPAG